MRVDAVVNVPAKDHATETCACAKRWVGLGWVGLGVREREKKGKRTKPVVQRRQELGLFEVLAAEHAVNVGAGNLDLVVVLLCSSL